MTPRRLPKHDQQRDRDTEQRILAAAHTVFVRRGTAGARMQEIAEEAGVNPALLHYYFRSKDRLATAVFHSAAAHIVPAVHAILGAELPLEEKVARFVEIYIDEIRRRPFIPPYIVAELHHHPERVLEGAAGRGGAPGEGMRTGLGLLQTQLDAEAAAGTIRPIAALQFLMNLVSLTVFPFLAQPLLRLAGGLEGEAFDRFLDERKREVPRFVMAGLRP